MRKSPTHLVEELVIVCEHALDELEGERLVEVLELEELGALAVAEQAQVLEDGERVARRGAERLCGSVGKRDRFELAGEEHAAILFDDLVDDEHDELAQRRRGSGRYDGGPRLVELETQEQGLRDQPSRTGRTEKVKQRQTHVGEQPMKTGRRSSSVCQPSVVRGRQSRGEVEERDHVPEVKLAVTSSGEDLRRARDFSAAYGRGIIVGVYVM